MLAIGLFCATVSVLAFLVGSLMMPALGAAYPVRLSDRAFAAAWLGFTMIALALLVVSFFAPLTPVAGASAAFGLGTLALVSKTVRASARATMQAVRARHVIAGCVLLIGVSLFGSVAPIFYDTAMYQYSASQWLAAFGVVRGLALFQHRLGTISPWYALVSPFETGALRGRMIGAPIALALWLTVWPVAIAAARCLTARDRPADRFMVLGIGGWVFWMLVVQHPAVVPSPDLAWSVLLLLSVWAWLLSGDAAVADAGADVTALPLLLASAAAGLRFNALPAAGCAWLFYVFAAPHAVSRAIRGAAIVALFVLPEIAASLRTSGCPLFPTAMLCLDRPWALGAQHAREYAAFVRWFARANEGRLITHPPTLDAGGWSWWMPVWLVRHFFVIAASGLTLAIALAPARMVRQFRLPALAAFACIAVTFVVAPANRFLVPYAICIPCALLAQYRWPVIVPARVRPYALHATIAVTTIILVARSGFHPRGLVSSSIPFSERNVSNDLALPEAIKQPDSLRVARSGSLVYYTTAQLPDVEGPISWRNPMDARCWGAPLPCTPHLAVPGVTLASPEAGLGGGFIKPPAAQPVPPD